MYGKKSHGGRIARDRILMPREWFAEMFAYTRRKNKLIVFSTVHRVEDIEFLLGRVGVLNRFH